MASIKDIAGGRSDVYMVRPDQLSVKEGWNGREADHPENIAHIDALAQSIAAEGVKETLSVYVDGENIFIENGHMRHAAALKAIAEYGAPADMLIPVKPTPRDASEADRVLSQIIRNSGRPLLPLEMAGVFQRLQALGLSDAEIGRRAGLSRVYIGQLIELSKMPKGVTTPVREGKVSATLAIQTMKRFDGDGKKTADALKNAILYAKSSGKAKATSKHVKKAAKEAGQDLPDEKKSKRVKAEGTERTERKSTFTILAEVRTTFESAEFEIAEKDGVEGVNVFFTNEQYRELTALLSLEKFTLPEREDELV